MNWKMALIAPIIVLAASACSKSDLDRDAAQALIEKSEQVQQLSASVSVAREFFDEGVAQGLWAKVNRSETRLSERAAKEISAIGSNYLAPVDPAKVTVTVTGVKAPAEGSKSRMVEFTWAYEGLSPLVKRFALGGGGGTATIELYDDGWRVSNVNLSIQPDRAGLSDSEVQAISADMAAETSRKDSERAKVLESIVPRAVIKEFNGVYYSAPKKFVISDNGVIYYSENIERGRGTGVMRPSGFVWFGAMADPRLGKWGIEFDFPSDRAPSINPERIDLLTTGIDYTAFLSALQPALTAWQTRYQATPRETRMKYLGEVNQAWRESKLWAN